VGIDEQTPLPQIGLAGHGGRVFAGPVGHGQQDRHQQCEDRDHNQQLDQRERPTRDLL
jgi:hypothetical protein